ncbi:MAG: hypothetical protein ABEI52_04005, partial [Halobacteriaceae archaeon]
ETKAETYFSDCPMHRCEGAVGFVYYYVRIGDDVSVVGEQYGGVDCTEADCEPNEDLLIEVVQNNEPHKVRDYHLPVKGIVTTSIHEHHTDYPKDETITVCAQCHSKIHHDDDFRPDLRPDPSWKEWQQMND